MINRALLLKGATILELRQFGATSASHGTVLELGNLRANKLRAAGTRGALRNSLFIHSERTPARIKSASRGIHKANCPRRKATS